MACYHPLLAQRASDGTIKLVPSGALHNLKLPCGQCVGCRLDRSRQWAIRCVHEASLYDENCFLTLTYDDEHLPFDLSLNYKHFQQFMKDLRRKLMRHDAEGNLSPIRFFMCGEYGEIGRRPHYHAILFNCHFPDRKDHAQSATGHPLYTSDILSRLWPHGYSYIGDVSFESAAYVARYSLKKINGSLADGYYLSTRCDPVTGEIFRLAPEFIHMSLKPGIGGPWFDKFHTDVFPHDRVIVDGHKIKVPKYYDKLLTRLDGFAFEEIKSERHEKFFTPENLADNSPKRLEVKETIAKSRLSFYKRSI